MGTMSALAEGSKKRRYANSSHSGSSSSGGVGLDKSGFLPLAGGAANLDASIQSRSQQKTAVLDRAAISGHDSDSSIVMNAHNTQDARQRYLHAVDVSLWQQFWIPSNDSQFFGGVPRGLSRHDSLMSSTNSSSYASSSSLSCFDAATSASSTGTSIASSGGGKYQTQPSYSCSEAALSESATTASWVDGQQQRLRDRRRKSLTNSSLYFPEQTQLQQPSASPTSPSPSSSSCSLPSTSSSPIATRKRSLSPVSTDTVPTSDASEGEDAGHSSKASSPSTSPTSGHFIARLKSRDERRHQQHRGKLYTQAIAAGRGIASLPPTIVGETTTPLSKRTFDEPYLLAARLKKRKVSHKIRSFLLLRPPGLPLIGTDGAADIAHIRTAPAWLKNATSELSRESRMSPSEYFWSSCEADQSNWAVSVLEEELRTRLRFDADIGAGQARNVDNTVCIQANAGPTVSKDGIVHIAFMNQPILPAHLAGLAITAANIPLSSPPAEDLAFPPVLLSPKRPRATQSLSPPASPTAFNRSPTNDDMTRKRQSSLPPPSSAVFNNFPAQPNQRPPHPMFGPFQLPPQDVPQSVLKAQLMAILRSRLGEAHRAAAAPLKMKKFAIWNACHKRTVSVSPRSLSPPTIQNTSPQPVVNSVQSSAANTAAAHDVVADSTMDNTAEPSALGLTDMTSPSQPVRSLSSAFSRPKSPTHQRIEQVYTSNAQPDASLTSADAEMCIDPSELLRSPRPTATKIAPPPVLSSIDGTPERPATPFVQISTAAPKRPKLIRSVSSPVSSEPVKPVIKPRSPSHGHQPLIARQRPYVSMSAARQLMSPPQHHAEGITAPA